MNIAIPLFLDMTIKAGFLCLAGMALTHLAVRRPAALRHDILMTVLACCGLLPVTALCLQLFQPVFPLAPMHSAALAVIPALPRAVPGGIVEFVDRIWSGADGLPPGPLLAELIIAIWLFGVGLAMLRTCLNYRTAAAITARAMFYPFACAQSNARVLVTVELSAPAVFGVFRPVILLPQDALSWPADRLQAVLAHETAHLERRDCLLELLVQLTCVVHWFNPLVWQVSRALRIERELACDERVVSAGIDARAYATTLVLLARSSLGPSPSALLAVARRPGLEQRVIALLATDSNRTRGLNTKLRVVIVCVAMALLVPLAAMTTPIRGKVGPGSVQPSSGSLFGLDDPLSERLPLPYDRLARDAESVPAEGQERHAIVALKQELHRQSKGHGDLVRERAIWALTQVREGKLFVPISLYSASSDWRLRAYAAWAMAVTGDRRATAFLVPMLRDPVWRVRAMASAALAELADPRASEAIGVALGDPAWQVRFSAVNYIDRVGDAALKNRLLPLLQDPHWGTRAEVERVLTP